MIKNICWMCDSNFPYLIYNGSKHLDEYGNKPCFDCLFESGVFDEETKEETENEF